MEGVSEQVPAHGGRPRVMLDPRLTEVLNKLGTSVDSINRNFINLNLNSLVEPYSGTEASKCRQWISAVEKIADATGLSEREKLVSLYLTARDHVSEFIKRIWTETENLTFADLKKALISNFSSVTEPSMAHDLLRKIKQKINEPITIFAERIYNLAAYAYTDAVSHHDSAQAVIQTQLVDYFISGLLSKHLKFKILSKRAKTLKEAVKIAKDEEELLRKYNAHGGVREFQPNEKKEINAEEEEPMEVARVRRGRIENNYENRNQGARNFGYRRTQVNEITRENDRKILHKDKQCYNCMRFGHIQYDCPERDGKSENRRNNYPNMKRNDQQNSSYKKTNLN